MWRALRPSLSALLLGSGACVYAARPDALALLSLLPAWCWLVPGLLLALPFRRRHPWWVEAVLIIGWNLFLAVFVEEPRSVLRAALPAPPRVASPAGLRVVSLNCGGGSPAAAREVLGHAPDVVLLQETPPEDVVKTLTEELYGAAGGYLWSFDTAILARGRLLLRGAPLSAPDYVAGRLQLRDGVEINLVSLRLPPPVLRFDFWSPEAWTVQRENRHVRRQRLGAILAGLDHESGGFPSIVGGDFNAPAGDAIYRLLRPQFEDAFAAAGRGWGNTALNDFPIARIDQVWVSREMTVQSAVALPTRHSDHRLVRCDLRLW